jgi:CheY-like chemotaxis protein
MPGGHVDDERGGPPRPPTPPASAVRRGEMRTDVRRALCVLAGGRWVRAHLPERGRAWAAVQLSKYTCDVIPVGVDVLGLLRGDGWVAEGRRLPGGERRFVLTAAGRAALEGASDPARARPRTEPAAPGRRGAPSARPLVVVAEDHPDARDAVAALLAGAGFLCTAVPDGAQLVRLLGAVRPDAIVLNLRMPVLDGLGVMERLRADPALRAIPVVAVGAGADPARAFAAVLPEPVDPGELLGAVHAVVGLRPRTPRGDPR